MASCKELLLSTLHLMPFGPAIAAILTIFFACWAFNMAREPKRWRLWWMHLLGVADLNSTREQRRRQEAQLSLMAYAICVLSLIVGASCIYWTAIEVQEARRPKTRFEQDLERTRREAEAIQSQRPFDKLR